MPDEVSEEPFSLTVTEKNSKAYPLYYCEATSKVINLTIDQELLCGFGWLDIVKTALGGTFGCNILAV